MDALHSRQCTMSTFFVFYLLPVLTLLKKKGESQAITRSAIVHGQGGWEGDQTNFGEGGFKCEEKQYTFVSVISEKVENCFHVFGHKVFPFGCNLGISSIK